MKYILSYEVRPDKGENRMYKNKVMTYNEWTILYKRALKRTIKQKFLRALEFLTAAALFLLPVWMMLDWLLRGY